MFPLQVRGQAIAAATFVNFSSNFLVSLALPSLQENLGPAGTYYLFAAVCTHKGTEEPCSISYLSFTHQKIPLLLEAKHFG